MRKEKTASPGGLFSRALKITRSRVDYNVQLLAQVWTHVIGGTLWPRASSHWTFFYNERQPSKLAASFGPFLDNYNIISDHYFKYSSQKLWPQQR